MANEITKITDQNSVDHPLRDAAAQTALTGILDGQSIDSFGDVESALAGKFPRSEQRILGAKSLVPNDAVTSTVNGVTLTVNDDKTVQAVSENTPTGNVWFVLCADVRPYLEVGESYIISGGKGINNEGYAVQLGNDVGVSWRETAQGGAETTFSLSQADFNTGPIVYRIGIKANVLASAINYLFKPMIRLATDIDDTYAQFAMTNKKLTDMMTPVDISNSVTMAEQSHYSFNYTPSISRNGNVCFVEGIITSVDKEEQPMGKSWTTAITGFPKPFKESPIMSPASNPAKNPINININTNGEFIVRGGSVGEAYYYNISYLIK